MKPQRFTIGQAVALRGVPKGPHKDHTAHGTEIAEPGTCPKPSEIYHVESYEMGRYAATIGEWYIFLREFPINKSYQESAFSPVISDSILEEALSEITQPMEV